MRRVFVAVIMLTGILYFGISEAVQTKLVVRAISKDAKFIGTSMGGALVIVKDSETGRVVTRGLTSGSTGNTQKIMIEPKYRGVRITEDSTAKFETVIDIDEPKLITIEVEAPYVRILNMIKSSTQVWLIPGKDITGDGIIVEIPGFSVDARVPDKIKLVNNRAIIPIGAWIVMI